MNKLLRIYFFIGGGNPQWVITINMFFFKFKRFYVRNKIIHSFQLLSIFLNLFGISFLTSPKARLRTKFQTRLRILISTRNSCRILYVFYWLASLHKLNRISGITRIRVSPLLSTFLWGHFAHNDLYRSCSDLADFSWFFLDKHLNNIYLN